MGERVVRNDEVVGSIPIGSTNLRTFLDQERGPKPAFLCCLAEQGRKRIVPWWRLIKTDGQLNPKYPGGVLIQKAKLEEEGHTIVRKGKKTLVKGVR